MAFTATYTHRLLFNRKKNEMETENFCTANEITGTHAFTHLQNICE